MSISNFARAAAAATLLASTASAAYSAGSTNNVAVYWGQGSNQQDLSTVCSDPSYDIVNIAFVNGFPRKEGDYPHTNFGNACDGTYFKHPTDSTQNNELLANCAGIAPGINKCRANGKKVLLSLGGGYPTNYSLPNEKVADYFAKFLVSAFGPKPITWTGPRPFGDAYVDGFDLDLEANAAELPSQDYIHANYAYFVRQLKAYQPNALISAAPQCVLPDPRLADAIMGAPFDMIFTQFYNTEVCSARTGYQERQAKSGDNFTFGKWASWLKANSNNKGVKLYMGLPAGPDGVGAHKDHYLNPEEVDSLVGSWKDTVGKDQKNFGGIMLWEAKVSSNNVVNGKNFGYWSKATLENRFKNEYNKYVSSSSTISTSTKTSSTMASSTSVELATATQCSVTVTVRLRPSSPAPRRLPLPAIPLILCLASLCPPHQARSSPPPRPARLSPLPRPARLFPPPRRAKLFPPLPPARLSLRWQRARSSPRPPRARLCLHLLPRLRPNCLPALSSPPVLMPPALLPLRVSTLRALPVRPVSMYPAQLLPAPLRLPALLCHLPALQYTLPPPNRHMSAPA